MIISSQSAGSIAASLSTSGCSFRPTWKPLSSTCESAPSRLSTLGLFRERSRSEEAGVRTHLDDVRVSQLDGSLDVHQRIRERADRRERQNLRDVNDCRRQKEEQSEREPGQSVILASARLLAESVQKSERTAFTSSLLRLPELVQHAVRSMSAHPPVRQRRLDRAQDRLEPVLLFSRQLRRPGIRRCAG